VNDRQRGPSDIVVLCTGNAARSVMAGYMLAHLAEVARIDLHVTTRGTHTIDGQPMGIRTRNALDGLGVLGELAVSKHRSRQLAPADLDRADLVVAMEADHVRFVRRRHPDAAGRTATIRRLCRDLPPGPGPLATRVARLDLGGVVLDGDEDVTDPAGLDEEAYAACAAELWELCQALVPRL